MADPCVPCSFTPYTNIRSCPPQNGISVLQSTCQILMDGNVVNNPCFNVLTGISTWTYRFFTDFTPGTSVSPIRSILIPICSGITQNNIIVEERIESYGKFTLIPFILSAGSEEYGRAPRGFQWLILENAGRYDKGVNVEYRISIAGNYPDVEQPIVVNAGRNRITFTGEGCYKVPGCPIPDRLEVDKDCRAIIQNNRALLEYNIDIKNTGGSELSQVQYQDIFNFDGANVTLDIITLPPELPLQLTSVAANTVIISGIIPKIARGQSIHFNYTIPVISFAQPGTFIFTNIATAASGNITASDTCTTTLEVVRLEGSSTVNITDGNRITSYMTVTNAGTSPRTNAEIVGEVVIPRGVVVEFKDFSECNASFQDGSIVPLNKGITDTIIKITHNNVPIVSGGGVRISINYIVISTSAFLAPVTIVNTLQQVRGINTNQIYLTPYSVPISSTFEVMGGCR